jgi:predicted  nucleic acid-binding Zn ribbon protein
VAVSLLWTPAALPVPVVTLWLTKDLLLMAGTAWWLHHTVSEPALIQATQISKINTGLQFATLAVAIGGQTEMVFWTNLSTTWLLPLCYVTSGTTVASIFSYRHQMAFPGLSAGLVCHQR